MSRTDPEYQEAITALAVVEPDLAETISRHVSALSAECASRTLEATELHALLTGITGGRDGRA